MKMSDALRGAAESAPIEGAHVSVSTVRSRTRRNRALRAGANGVVGVGAAALVIAGVVGVVNGQTGISTADAESGNRQDVASGGDGAMEPGFVGQDDVAGMGPACGSDGGLQMFDVGNVLATADLTSTDDGTAAFTLTYSVGDSNDTSYTVGSPVAYILWGDVVVATGDTSHDGALLTIGPGEPASLGAGFDLVNCWDGTALPAGDYRLITVTQMVPVATPVDEPAGAPPTEPGTDPDTSVSSDSGDASADAPAYALSEAVPFTIAGDPVDDPFGTYLSQPAPLPTEPSGPATPSDALTSDAARTAYEKALLSGAWDMAPGTQRVVLTGDSERADQDLWSAAYYGCPSDGVGATFPERSADLDWLSVSASLPQSISVSYGWVVDGNPLIRYHVTNDTDWSLPGFYAGSSPRLVLVEDGMVVAEAYPVSPEQNYGGIAYATDGMARDALIYDPSSGYLAPGATTGGDFLWRDLSGCWTDSGSAPVAPGTYTVLAVQDLYLGAMYGIMEDQVKSLDSQADSGGGDEPVEPIMAPATDTSDYVSFSVWTSLGSLKVQN